LLAPLPHLLSFPTRRSSDLLFLRIVLPAALPFVVAGLRLGISVAFIVLVAAEMTGADAGLGFRIEESHLLFRSDRMVIGLLLLGDRKSTRLNSSHQIISYAV